MNLAQLFYEEESIGVFLLVSVAMGGGAAWLAGRAIAGTWRNWWQVAGYMVILGGAVRFIHYALFEGTLLSPQYYVVDTAICLIFGLAGYRVTRVRKMVSQYRFRNERTGVMSWRRRQAAAPGSAADSG